MEYSKDFYKVMASWLGLDKEEDIISAVDKYIKNDYINQYADIILKDKEEDMNKETIEKLRKEREEIINF